MVSTTVSLDSKVVSPTTLKLVLPEVLPIGMEMEVGALVKSVFAVAVPLTVIGTVTVDAAALLKLALTVTV